MNSHLEKQLLVGGLAGLLVLVLIYLVLGGKRDDLAVLNASNITLQADVNRGYALKDIYEKLKVEVDQQQKVIEALVRIMPTDADRGEMPFRIKKLADEAGIEQVSFALMQPLVKEYYTEYPVQFTFRAGYHTLGQFSSLVSGYEKIINIEDLQMKRDTVNPLYPVSVSCKISAFVYNPVPSNPAPHASAPAPAPGPKKEGD